jgi:hypothetical protein
MSERLVTLLARLLSGLQVPGDLGVLGAAEDPWRELRQELGLSGWHRVEEIEADIQVYLAREAPSRPQSGSTRSTTGRRSSLRSAPAGSASASRSRHGGLASSCRRGRLTCCGRRRRPPTCCGCPHPSPGHS